MKYSIYFQDCFKAERDVRDFLYSQCNIVRLTYWPHKVKSLKTLIFPNVLKQKEKEDKVKFLSFLDSVKDELIKIEGETTETPYYYFKLSSIIKDLLNKNQEGIVGGNGGGLLPFMENPAFFNNDELIGNVISHEPIIDLYLTPVQKKDFDSKGVLFDGEGLKK